MADDTTNTSTQTAPMSDTEKRRTEGRDFAEWAKDSFYSVVDSIPGPLGDVAQAVTGSPGYYDEELLRERNRKQLEYDVSHMAERHAREEETANTELAIKKLALQQAEYANSDEAKELQRRQDEANVAVAEQRAKYFADQNSAENLTLEKREKEAGVSRAESLARSAEIQEKMQRDLAEKSDYADQATRFVNSMKGSIPEWQGLSPEQQRSLAPMFEQMANMYAIGLEYGKGLEDLKEKGSTEEFDKIVGELKGWGISVYEKEDGKTYVRFPASMTGSGDYEAEATPENFAKGMQGMIQQVQKKVHDTYKYSQDNLSKTAEGDGLWGTMRSLNKRGMPMDGAYNSIRSLMAQGYPAESVNFSFMGQCFENSIKPELNGERLTTNTISKLSDRSRMYVDTWRQVMTNSPTDQNLPGFGGTVRVSEDGTIYYSDTQNRLGLRDKGNIDVNDLMKYAMENDFSKAVDKVGKDYEEASLYEARKAMSEEFLRNEKMKQEALETEIKNQKLGGMMQNGGGFGGDGEQPPVRATDLASLHNDKGMLKRPQKELESIATADQMIYNAAAEMLGAKPGELTNRQVLEKLSRWENFEILEQIVNGSQEIYTSQGVDKVTGPFDRVLAKKKSEIDTIMKNDPSNFTTGLKGNGWGVFHEVLKFAPRPDNRSKVIEGQKELEKFNDEVIKTIKEAIKRDGKDPNDHKVFDEYYNKLYRPQKNKK